MAFRSLIAASTSGRSTALKSSACIRCGNRWTATESFSPWLISLSWSASSRQSIQNLSAICLVSCVRSQARMRFSSSSFESLHDAAIWRIVDILTGASSPSILHSVRTLTPALSAKVSRESVFRSFRTASASSLTPLQCLHKGARSRKYKKSACLYFCDMSFLCK